MWWAITITLTAVAASPIVAVCIGAAAFDAEEIEPELPPEVSDDTTLLQRYWPEDDTYMY